MYSTSDNTIYSSEEGSHIFSSLKQTGNRWSHLTSSTNSYGYASADTPCRPASAITTASSNSSSSVESSGSSGSSSIMKMKPVNLLKDFRHSSQHSLNWDMESSELNAPYDISERVYDEQLALITVQKKEINELREQVQKSKLQILRLLGSETELNSQNISQQQIELENTALKVKLAEMSMSKDREADIMKSNFSEMQGKYERALIGIGKESEEKTKHILSLQDAESELKHNLSDKEDENIILRKQIKSLHATFLKQSQTISNDKLQIESKWINHIEKQNASIASHQEQVKIDDLKLTRVVTEMKQVLDDNESLRIRHKELEVKLRDSENEVKTANDRTERELTNMRIRHKEKYNQQLKFINDENMKLKAQQKLLEKESKRTQIAFGKLENELERTKALKATGEQPHLFDTLYDKIRECVTEFQTIFCYLQSIGTNESDSFMNISQDYSLTLGHVNPEDRIKQLSKIHSRMKECHEYLETKYLSNMTQECTLQ
ncbi:hypothetical protein LOD99_11616 [Oopsacas minuta]|uniref:Uncharacterized protein n=1 Tax=Oopsacas minuta TaxID=111878 RepID=A0AAV7JL63_9METZ|nr:hypothetical protein LOD99_11616 [Oopsacas minuta]